MIGVDDMYTNTYYKGVESIFNGTPRKYNPVTWYGR